MSQYRKSDKNKVFERSSTEVSSSEPQSSSASKCSSDKMLVASKLFSWNREKPRRNSEYVEKKYLKPFNKVAPELRMIGGLGEMKCVRRNERKPLVNRPTQVQKLCHTTTKLLPNFHLTEQLRPIACRKKKILSILEAAEQVKFAENLPMPSNSHPNKQEKTKEIFNHQNPFNLDLKASSDDEKQKHNAEEVERRRNYEIIRRTMETKALKTEGAERIKQRARDEKFKLPIFFNVCDSIVNEVEAAAESTTSNPIDGCKFVSTMEKPENREILHLHYRHKEEKLRKRLQAKAHEEKILAKEMEHLEEESRENFVFRLADNSFPASECDVSENIEMKDLPAPALQKFDYPVNESELAEFKRQLNEKSLKVIKRDKLPFYNANENDVEIEISREEKDESRVVHDRFSAEPKRVKTNHRSKEANIPTCLTHKEWLDSLANDPEILRKQPRGRILSTFKIERDQNNDKLLLFDDSKIKNNNIAIVSSIREHIRKIDEKLKIRNRQTNLKKSRSHISCNDMLNGNQDSKRYQRMKFMGIPVSQSSRTKAKVSQVELRTIVANVSQPSILSQEILSNDKFSSIRKQSNVRLALEDVKLVPKKSHCDCSIKEEREHSISDKFSLFTKAQPRGSNARNLRVDKSLPWIEDELNATRAKITAKLKEENGKSFTTFISDTETRCAPLERKIAESESELKKSYNRIIAAKLQVLKMFNATSSDDVESKVLEDEQVVDEIQSTVDMSSSLSSTGTYFTNDSGSFVLEHDRKIPMSELNVENKFQNRSVVTTREVPLLDLQPFVIPHISQYKLIKDLCKPKDKFHTYRTRSCANIRERNHIKSPDYENELIGTEEFRMVSQVATDIDEYYQSEIYHERSRTKFRFQPITEIIKLRETLRKKMDIFWIKERMILDEQKAVKLEAMLKLIDIEIKVYDGFVDDYKKKIYVHATKTMHKVKSFYDETDRLQKLYQELKNNSEPLKMKIFLLGNEFVRLTVLQKFQYLLKSYEWRLINDRIHRTPVGQLEKYKDSITNRETAFLWKRENVTVYTIKDFIVTDYLPNEPKLITIFSSGGDILEAFQLLRSKSYLSLLQFHLTAHTLTETEEEFIILEEKNNAYSNNLERLVQSLDKKRVFMKARSEEIQLLTLKMLDKPLEESVAAKKLRSLRGICELGYQKIILKNGDTSKSKYFPSTEKICEVEKKILNLFDELDEIPQEVISELEKEERNKRKRKLLLAKRAYKIELDVQNRVAQFQRCLTKPPKKIKREGKLPISVLPKKPSKIKIKKPLLTQIEEEYIRAFTELGDDSEVKFDKHAKLMIDRIQNESIPFYVDHLLQTIGIEVSKETNEATERILQDEAKNFKYKDILPSVRSQVKRWQIQSETTKKENIRKTPYLYQ